jgi:uncharacterized membrane protein
MNERPSLREALRNANIEAMEESEETGRQAVAAVAAALAMPQPRRFEPSEEEERQRLLDAALGDVVEIVNRHRMRLGRRTCSSSDAKIIRQIHELLRGMAGADGGNDSDPSFQ